MHSNMTPKGKMNSTHNVFKHNKAIKRTIQDNKDLSKIINEHLNNLNHLNITDKIAHVET